MDGQTDILPRHTLRYAYVSRVKNELFFYLSRLLTTVCFGFSIVHFTDVVWIAALSSLGLTTAQCNELTAFLEVRRGYVC